MILCGAGDAGRAGPVGTTWVVKVFAVLWQAVVELFIGRMGGFLVSMIGQTGRFTGVAVQRRFGGFGRARGSPGRRTEAAQIAELWVLMTISVAILWAMRGAARSWDGRSA